MIEMQRELRDLRERLERLEKTDLGPVTGTYVPTYLGGSTAGVTTYSFQEAAWTLIGDMVTVRGQVVWTAATGTGNAQISLPFTAAAANFTGALYLNGVTFTAVPEMLITLSTAFFTMASPASNAGPTTIAVEAAGNVIWTCTYFVA